MKACIRKTCWTPLILALTLAACGGDEAPEGGEQPEAIQPAAGSPAVGVQAGERADHTITISFDETTGTISVDTPELTVGHGSSIQWQSTTHPDAAWIVAFAATHTPFRSGNNIPFIFHGPSSAPGNANTTGTVGKATEVPGGAYKYSVFWPNPHPDSVGSYIVLDPKLVIEDSPPDSIAVQ